MRRLVWEDCRRNNWTLLCCCFGALVSPEQLQREIFFWPRPRDPRLPCRSRYIFGIEQGTNRTDSNSCNTKQPQVLTAR